MEDGRQSLWSRLMALYKKHEELVRYIVVGGLTTLINYGVYALGLQIFADPAVGPHIANAIAFVVAVIFAYYANKYGVFHTKTKDKLDAAREAGSFFLMRLISFGFEEGILYLLINVLRLNELFAKIPVNIIVVLLNYGFSKLFIFRKPSQAGAAGDKTDR